MAEVTVSMRAYCKLILHAAKYPHSAVNGILLAEDTKGKEHKTLKFVDCIPLFHITLGLAPMLEIALLQIDTYCRSKGYVIGGYYHANENYDDLQIDHIAKTIGRKVNQNFPDACLFLIDNRKVSTDSVSEVYKVYTLQKNSWKELDSRQTVDEETLTTARSLLNTAAYRKLLDFDNHLDDVKLDWRNLEINEEISRCT